MWVTKHLLVAIDFHSMGGKNTMTKYCDLMMTKCSFWGELSL